MRQRLRLASVSPGTSQVKIVYCTLRPGGNPEVEGHWRMHARRGDDLVVQSGKRQAVELEFRLPAGGN